MAKLAVVTEPPGLVHLARQINDEYQAARREMGKLAGHALEIGGMLVEAKTRVKAQKLSWIEWVEANLPFGRVQASKYLRLAKNAPENDNRGYHLDDSDPPPASLRASLRALMPPQEPRQKAEDGGDEADEDGDDGPAVFKETVELSRAIHALEQVRILVARWPAPADCGNARVKLAAALRRYAKTVEDGGHPS